MQTARTSRSHCVKRITFAWLLGTALTMHSQQLLDVTAQAGPMRTQPPAAAIWLTPLHTAAISAPATGKTYTLLQKNKQFIPHLLIVPVGSVVRFPNADPFFHNVFSEFEGRRFDLGLYEAGSSKDITFSREGVSYIFCNIHPEMSAVVIALSTPFYSVLGTRGRFHIANVPPDDYMLHVWVEGEGPGTPNVSARRVRISADHTDLGVIRLPAIPHGPMPHDNEYGQTYDNREPDIY
jgi:plastocyanin